MAEKSGEKLPVFFQLPAVPSTHVLRIQNIWWYRYTGVGVVEKFRPSFSNFFFIAEYGNIKRSKSHFICMVMFSLGLFCI